MKNVGLTLLLVGYGASLTPPSPYTPPWMDTSLCLPTDSLTLCQLKKSQCAPLDHLLTPPGGVLSALTTCALTSGVPLSANFFMGVGAAYMQGAPEALIERASPDPATASSLRRCVLNSTGLLDPSSLALNRTAIAGLVRGALTSSPGFGAAVATTVMACPEPLDYDVRVFVVCVKAACMTGAATSSPLVAAARAYLPSLTPAAKDPPVQPPKLPIPVPIIFP